MVTIAARSRQRDLDVVSVPREVGVLEAPDKTMSAVTAALRESAQTKSLRLDLVVRSNSRFIVASHARASPGKIVACKRAARRPGSDVPGFPSA